MQCVLGRLSLAMFVDRKASFMLKWKQIFPYQWREHPHWMQSPWCSQPPPWASPASTPAPAAMPSGMGVRAGVRGRCAPGNVSCMLSGSQNLTLCCWSELIIAGDCKKMLDVWKKQGAKFVGFQGVAIHMAFPAVESNHSRSWLPPSKLWETLFLVLYFK